MTGRDDPRAQHTIERDGEIVGYLVDQELADAINAGSIDAEATYTARPIRND